ncbi:hypothetical protein [Streptomyces sp. H39-C1]|uniref:hypothetical protein n=1 Tax=Streptomyces sp. H39-C1 TaxID=3004355 RepID=UPI0022AF2EC5|nr:hypothetical protein [Streptomyces sp. H39-C1]MCZ4103425.1 hypothetical protein [Streptomyces sp. H39-C1]
MRHIFLNGPIQNGPFTFETTPGKAVGIRLAAALNAVIGAPPVPHLWNTVTLAGDLRHRQHTGSQVTREAFESDLIAAKYPPGQPPVAGTLTDTDTEVASLALEMIETNLRAGTLAICRESVPTCRGCGHMTGNGTHPCNACGSTYTEDRTGLHLVAELAKDRPVLDRSDLHAGHRQQPKHLQNSAGNITQRLILSRTRDHGIDLGPLGLPGLVLDPRVGVHVTVLAAARRLQATTAVMTITQNAANHVAAHGQHFRTHDGTRLQYALHGHLPYDRTADLQAAYEAYRASPGTVRAFETWFLPLFSLKEKNGTSPAQLPALFKHFIRARMAQPAEPNPSTIEAVRHAIANGITDWVMSRHALAAVMPAREAADSGESAAKFEQMGSFE